MPKPTFSQLPDRQKRKIVRVCTRLFSQHGYAHTSLKMINRELRVADGYLYYYFDGKEDLTKWVVETGLDTLKAHFHEHVLTQNPADLFTLYRLTVLQMARFIRDFPDLYGGYFLLINEPNLPMASWLTQKVAWIDDIYSQAMEREMGSGRVRTDIDPNLVAMLLDVVNTRIQEFIFKPSLDPIGVSRMNEEELAAMVDAVIDVVRNGLKPVATPSAGS